MKDGTRPIFWKNTKSVFKFDVEDVLKNHPDAKCEQIDTAVTKQEFSKYTVELK